MNQFVALAQPGSMALVPPGWPPMATVGAEPPARPSPPEVEAMRFWTSIFVKAKSLLEEDPEPGDRSKLGFSIRDKTTWEEVRVQLGRARDEYEGREQGIPGKVKKGIRIFGKTVATPGQQIIKVVPNHAIVSPVLAAVNLLLGAWKEAAKVPGEISDQFDDLGALFADIDLFTAMFPDGKNIVTASVNLVYAIFKAIESAIGFYISWQDNIDKAKKDDQLVQIRLFGINSFYGLLSEVSLQIQISFPARTIIVRSREPSPQPELLEMACTPQLLWESLDIPKLDDEDMEFILGRASRLPREDRGRAEQVVATPEFRDWILNRDGTKLLVHGDFGAADYVSPLSVVCATMVQALRSRPGFVSLVFFCGRHLSRGEENTGGVALMRSFIAQFLRQYPYCPSTLDPNISLDEVKAGNREHLCNLFFALARMLPATTMLVCIIDGILLYERRQFKDDMDEVLGAILELAEDDDSMRAPVKVLVTSPRETRYFSGVFMSSGSLLSMSRIRHTGRGPTRTGVAGLLDRELGGSSNDV